MVGRSERDLCTALFLSGAGCVCDVDVTAEVEWRAGEPREPVGLLVTEPSELLVSPLLSGFLLFLLDNRLLAMALVVVKSALAMIVSLSATRDVATECHA